MNTFVTILSFALLACVAAKPGYNYQQPHEVGKQTLFSSAPVSSSGISSAQQSQPITSFNVHTQTQPQFSSQYSVQSQYASSVPQYSASAAAPAVQQFVGPAPQYVAPVQQHPAYTPAVSSNQFQYQQHPQQTIVNKEIFIHSAPEETEVIGEQKDFEAGPAHKNYRIVFIKAPAHNIKLNVDSLKRAQAANEEKTVIYVLSKKPDLANIQKQLVNVPVEQKTNKPEVFFIKYKTPEEAHRAQQEIQAQYDALGGSTRVSDEGIAPITSVIGGNSAIGVHSVNAGQVGPSFISSGSAPATFVSSGGSVGNGANFVHSVSNTQQFHSTQSTGSFGIEAPSSKYLPIIKKK